MKRTLPQDLYSYDWALLSSDIDECSDFINWYEDCTLDDILFIRLVNARLMLTRYEAYLKDKPNNAIYLSEVDRYRSRIQSLETAAQTL